MFKAHVVIPVLTFFLQCDAFSNKCGKRSASETCPEHIYVPNAAVGQWVISLASFRSNTMCISALKITISRNGLVTRNSGPTAVFGACNFQPTRNSTHSRRPTLTQSDNHIDFPSSNGWFKINNLYPSNQGSTWDYVRLRADGSAEIRHFCSHGECTGTYGRSTNFCCCGRGKRISTGIDISRLELQPETELFHVASTLRDSTLAKRIRKIQKEAQTEMW